MKTELSREEVSADGYRFAIITSRWNAAITGSLSRAAADALRDAGAASVEHIGVPGAFELPLASLTAARTGRFDAIIAIGVVIRGDTPHFDYVAGESARGIMSASLETGLPVLFGVITADTLAQAEERSGDDEFNKGREAALSAIEMAVLMRELADPALKS